VQVCAGLRAIWEMFRKGEQFAQIQEWMTFNDSPGGYAIMSVSGVAVALSAGMALALRPDADSPWSICIVRWIRSDDASRVELGLQVVAEGVRNISAVTVGFRGGEIKVMTPALLLPPYPPVRHSPAILVKTGTYSSPRFVLVDEAAGHLYVTQGRVQSLDIQTANIELFQFENDLYPT
jgi:cyclic-di-GMP-binding protein